MIGDFCSVFVGYSLRLIVYYFGFSVASSLSLSRACVYTADLMVSFLITLLFTLLVITVWPLEACRN